MSQDKKKILFFMTALHLGGGERVTVDLMNYFAQNGNDILLVVMKEKNSSIHVLHKNVRTINLSAATFLSAIKKLIGVIKREKPDVVYASSPHTNIAMLLALFFSGIKARGVVRVGIPLSVIFGRFSSFKDKYILPFLTKVLYRRADVIIAVSSGIATDTQLVTGARKDKIHVVYNPKGIDFIREKSNEYVPEVFKKHQEPSVLFVGRLVEQKDPQTLVRSFAELLAKQKAHLIIVGDGSLKNTAVDLSKELGIEKHVSFEGVQENPYVYMKNADVLVSSSRWEGLPNVIIESLVCGTPVVATDCPSGGPREILELVSLEKNLTPAGDSVELAKVISRVITKQKDVFDVAQFSSEKIMLRYREIFQV